MNKRRRPIYVLSPKIHLRLKDTHRLKVKRWKKILHTNGKGKNGVAVPISEKIDFKTKAIVRDKEWHYIMIKGQSNKRI